MKLKNMNVKDGLIVNTYRWNDDLCQYELIKTNDVKGSKEVMKQKHNKRKVMAEAVNDGDVDLFFDSMTEASEKFNVQVSTIFNYMKSGKIYKGYKFKDVCETPLKESVNNDDFDYMRKIISAIKNGKRVERRKKCDGSNYRNYESVNSALCDFENYEYRIVGEYSKIMISDCIESDLKIKLIDIASKKKCSINALFKGKVNDFALSVLKEFESENL